MGKLTNASMRARAHMTYRHRTPWTGTTEEFTGGSDSFILLLLAVEPGPHAEDERLEVFVGDKLATAHPLKWMMQMYEHNASMLLGNGSGDPETEQAMLYDNRDLVAAGEQLRYIIRRLTIGVEEVRSTEQLLDPDTVSQLAQMTRALKAFADVALRYQSVTGVRLGRAVLMPPGQKVEIRTTAKSPVWVTSGGLAALR